MVMKENEEIQRQDSTEIIDEPQSKEVVEPETSNGVVVDEDDFDDDEFGDFESADVDEVDKSPQLSKQSSIDAAYFPTLEQIMKDENFWVTEGIGGNEEYETSDLASLLDVNVENEESASVSLWKLLYVIEETNALKFRWPNSKVSSFFLDSIDVFEPNLTDVKSTEDGAVSTTSDAVSNLNCDFFQNSPVKHNGKSLLDDDLAAWGLDSSTESTKTQNGNNNGINGAISYLSVESLSSEAKTFLGRLPNLHFMLSDRVVKTKKR
ncbi:unnamed protein product [Bursaphelenchus okinawaensis]|uniref:Aftiphilin clathrin-binding box domain-containing protein n=1 Tax=Bursaphelenchus okinawaensis TaxID=465554 RepID=A0A811L7Z6_9BILA|nr:unnamed protein product [Bursaphelenchus okinawaensis]CAG9117833.1 unnamed protein product [Bursaphelenchus okinawaensis]